MIIDSRIRLVSSPCIDTMFNKKTHRSFIAPNGIGYWDYNAALAAVNEPKYIPMHDEPQSWTVELTGENTYIKNIGRFNFSNYKYLETKNNMEVWVRK